MAAAPYIVVAVCVIVGLLVRMKIRSYQRQDADARAALVKLGFKPRANNPIARVDGERDRYFESTCSFDGALANGTPVTIIFGMWRGEQYLQNRVMMPAILPCSAAYLEPAPAASVLASFAATAHVRVATPAGRGAVVVWAERPVETVLAAQLAQLASAFAV